MRPLIVAFGLFGLVLGLAAAVTLHGLPAVIVGRFGWFAYTPLAPVATAPSAAGSAPVSIDLQWGPALFSLGGLGLVVGVAAALVLARLGWRLARPSR